MAINGYFQYKMLDDRLRYRPCLVCSKTALFLNSVIEKAVCGNCGTIQEGNIYG